MLVLLVTAYGVGAAGAGLFQVRQLLEGRRSCEVSALFFAVYAGGYAIWLVYGLSIGSLPLIVVDGIGVVCATLTLAIALSLRGSLLAPSTWRSCPSSRTVLPRRAGPRAIAQLVLPARRAPSATAALLRSEAWDTLLRRQLQDGPSPLISRKLPSHVS